jgi:hypothetical protein
VFLTAGGFFIALGLGILFLGVAVYLIRAKKSSEFPFAPAEERTEG